MSKIKQFMLALRRGLEAHYEAAPGNLLMACVSGGADSTALFYGLVELADEMGFRLAVLHVNHGIRGKESNTDEVFVRNMCRKENVPFYCKRLGFKPGAKISEAKLRKERLRAIVEGARGVGASAAVLAHHRDDLAETFLLRLLRGSGLKGLAGFPVRSEYQGLTLLRPLKNVPRELIIAFLKARKIPWREDHTNIDTSYLRNRIRHELIPLLESKFNPDIKRTLTRTAAIFAQLDSYIGKEAETLREKCVERITVVGFPQIEWASVKMLYPLPDFLLSEMFRQWIMQIIQTPLPPGFAGTEALVRLVREGKSGSLLRLAHGVVAFRDYERITLSRTTLPRGARKSEMLSEITPPLLQLQNRTLCLPLFPDVDIRLEIQKRDIPARGKKKTSVVGNIRFVLRTGLRRGEMTHNRAVIPLGGIKPPIVIRNRRAGDKITISGITKSLKKWYNELRIPVPLRNHLIIVEDTGGIIRAGGQMLREQGAKSGRGKYLSVEWEGRILAKLRKADFYRGSKISETTS